MSKVIVVDAERCVACQQCRIDCAVAHGPAGTLAEAVACGFSLRPRIYIEQVGPGSVPIQCRHCQDAPCMLVCPKDAIRRAWPEEPVLIDAEACVGCGFCVLVCPFGVVEVAGDPKVALQCDLCADRREAGEEPACVAACPTAALRCVELDDRLREERRAVSSLVAEFLAAHAAGPDEKQRRACCELCGRDVAPRKLLEQLRAKLPANVPVGNVCPRCRRSRSAAIFAERLAYVGTAEGRKEAGSVGPGGRSET